MINFKEIIYIIKEYKGLIKDKEVAELLRMKQKPFGVRKHRNSVPEKELILFCQRELLDYNELLEGKIVPHSFSIKDAQMPYTNGGDDQKGVGVQSGVNVEKLASLISKTSTILSSGDTVTVSALSANIEAFYESVQRKNKLEKQAIDTSSCDTQSEENTEKKVM